MATIIINGVTHRQACTDSGHYADLIAYDATIDAFLVTLGAAARAAGFDFEIDKNAQATTSYRVTDEVDHQDLATAHEFMQSPAADFWAYFQRPI